MYSNFYGFDNKPFSTEPGANILFVRESPTAILSSLKSGISNQFGLMVVTGDIGTGKSTLARTLLNRLDPHYTAAILTSTPYKTLEELLTNIFIAFKIKDHLKHNSEPSNLLFENFLTTEFRNKRKVLLIIDDAHNLSVDLLENIRLLSNFTINNKQIIQFVLFGQKSLIDSLKIPELGQLINSVSLLEELSPFSLKETHEYIHHRLKHAGAKEDKVFFTQKACSSIYELSCGIPSLINQLCELTLNTAFSKKIQSIDSDLIDALAYGQKTSTVPNTEDHLDNNISQEYKLDEEVLPTGKLDIPKDQNKISLPLSSADSHSVIEEFATTIITEDLTSSNNSKPIVKAAIAKLKSTNVVAFSESQQPVESNITVNKDIQTKTHLNTSAITSKKISTKKPNRWLITTLASLCIANMAIYLYSTKGNLFLEKTFLSKQYSTSTNKKMDGQATNETTGDTENSVFIMKEIDLQSEQSTSDNSPATSSQTAPITLPLQSSAKNIQAEIKSVDSQLASLSTDSTKKTHENDDPQQTDKPFLAEQPLNKNEEITKLIAIAKSQFSEMYLTTPKKNNALDTYKKILELDSENQAALDGLRDIKYLYVYWAKQEIKKGDFRQAKTFIKKALQVAPQDYELHTLMDSFEQQTLSIN